MQIKQEDKKKLKKLSYLCKMIEKNANNNRTASILYDQRTIDQIDHIIHVLLQNDIPSYIIYQYMV